MSDERDFPLEGKRLFVAGHQGMVESAIIRALRRRDCRIQVTPWAEVDYWWNYISVFHKTLFLDAGPNKYKTKSIKINRANYISRHIKPADCLCRTKKWRFIHSAVAGWIG